MSSFSCTEVLSFAFFIPFLNNSYHPICFFLATSKKEPPFSEDYPQGLQDLLSHVMEQI